MQIVRSLEAYRSDEGLLLTIGVFDGVHVGHRAVLERLRASRTPGTVFGALTFEHHPQAFLHPGHAPKALTTMAEKINLLDECGLDVLFVLPFDERIQQLSAQTFLTDVLLAKLHTRMLIVGNNWRFGKDREGDVDLARRVLEKSGCALEVESLLTRDGERVSSSRIRELIEERRFAQADELLGSPFTVRGLVGGGEGRGHLLGFPTANLEIPEEKLVPTPGVYGSIVRRDGTDYRGVVSIGDKPTFGGTRIDVEVYILDFDHSIYGEELAIREFDFVREQQRFENAAALVAQMRRDVERVNASARTSGDRRWH